MASQIRNPEPDKVQPFMEKHAYSFPVLVEEVKRQT